MGYIYIRNKGGLGNQLFIYNFGLFMSTKYGLNLIVDNTTGFYNDNYGRTPIINKVLNFKLLEPSFLQKLSFFLFKKAPFFHIFFNSVLINEDSEGSLIDFNQLKINSKTRVYVDGYFQKIYYFDKKFLNIRDSVSRVYNFDAIYEAYNKQINSTNSVCVHIRRNAYDNLLAKEYYLKSMNKMRDTLPKPVFYIFSDSLEWCRMNILGSDLEFIENEGNIDDLQEFFLMKNCRHFIIANSTFSWWAAFLGVYSNKMVIAPKKNQLGDNNSLYPINWICV